MGLWEAHGRSNLRPAVHPEPPFRRSAHGRFGQGPLLGAEPETAFDPKRTLAAQVEAPCRAACNS
jgi:hypothetical protein